jgi:hypothetical protein
MAYGQNQAWGLLPERTLLSASNNAQTNTYFIASGYAQNIFVGDPVYLGADGFIHSLFEQGGGSGTFQILGVFNGVDYIAPTAVTPIAPGNPKRIWESGSVTVGGVPAPCQIYDDPNVIYNVQVDGPSFAGNPAGITWEAQGSTATLTFTANAGQVQGNFQTGNSLVVLNTASIGVDATQNVRILRFVPPPTQVVPTPGGAALPYVNVEVLIQNHSFAQRAVGL